MKVVVASKNPVKINSVLEGFNSYFNETIVEGVSVESGVSDQPVGDNETYKGAKNRAKNAMTQIHDANFWVGIEGGIEATKNGLIAFAWVIILSKDNQGESKTTTFRLPQKAAQLISEGHELGYANDIIFKQNNSKQKQGAVGLLTQNNISRKDLYKQAVQLALIPFINPKLF